MICTSATHALHHKCAVIFNASLHCYYPPAGGGGGYYSSPFVPGGDGLLSECLRVLTEQLKCHSDRQHGRSTHRAPESLLYPANPTEPEHTEGRQEQIKNIGEPKKKKRPKKKKQLHFIQWLQIHHNPQERCNPPLSVVMKAFWGGGWGARSKLNAKPLGRTTTPAFRRKEPHIRAKVALLHDAAPRTHLFFLFNFFFCRQYHSSRPEGGVQKSKLLRK